MQKSVISTRMTRPYWFQPSSVVLCILNSILRTKIACVYGSQTSPVALCMQNSVISIGITSLCGSQPSFVGFECKTASFCPELQVSMVPIPHLSFYAWKTAWLATSLCGLQTSPVVFCMQYSVISTRITCLYVFQHLSVVFACKTAAFGAELQICMVPRPHLSFCACKIAWLASELLVSKGSSSHLRFCAF